jgi:hypothetical protein
MKRQFAYPSIIGALLLLASVLGSPRHLLASEAGLLFATPGEAVAALSRAVSTTNRAALDSLFGPAVQDLVNPDEVQGAAEFADFAAAFNITNRLVRESDTRMVLEIGSQDWPFPIPLVKSADSWHFDTVAGREEILNRRIGRNELAVLRVMRALVQAQREYASRDRDGDDVLEYAQRIASSAGQTDGLYWRFDVNGEISPLGPLVAYAHGEGYSRRTTTAGAGPQPFHGYFFKMLTRQGKQAPGGKYDYVINGNMIGGFAFVAWPAEHGESGVMTFIVNQLGRVYQKDLGATTARQVRNLNTYDPDDSWHVSAD